VDDARSHFNCRGEGDIVLLGERRYEGSHGSTRSPHVERATRAYDLFHRLLDLLLHPLA
jgi:hypothetical protein